MKELILLSITLLMACPAPSEQTSHDPDDWRNGTLEEWQLEVLAAEDSFARYAETHGIGEAFLAFADSTAVLMRNEEIVRDLPAHFGELHGPDRRQLSWKPDFVQVSASGDLAYTYGSYEYKPHRDSSQAFTGIFHTVWKRQADGSWKYVWD